MVKLCTRRLRDHEGRLLGGDAMCGGIIEQESMCT